MSKKVPLGYYKGPVADFGSSDDDDYSSDGFEVVTKKPSASASASVAIGSSATPRAASSSTSPFKEKEKGKAYSSSDTESDSDDGAGELARLKRAREIAARLLGESPSTSPLTIPASKQAKTKESEPSQASAKSKRTRGDVQRCSSGAAPGEIR